MYKNNILKLGILLICLLISNISNSLANELQPEVNFPREIRILGDQNIEDREGDENILKPQACAFRKRLLGKNSDEIKTYNKKIYKTKIYEENFKNKYKLIFVEKNTLEFDGLNIYVMNKKNDICIGYILFSGISYDKWVRKSKESLFDIDITIQKILKLNKTNYVYDKVFIPKGTELSFYEKNKENYIERYSIAKNDQFELLLLDSFYPNDLEELVKKTAIRVIDRNLYFCMEKDKKKNFRDLLSKEEKEEIRIENEKRDRED